MSGAAGYSITQNIPYPERQTPPPGYADGKYVGGATPMPGWVCVRCGALVVRTDWHTEWHNGATVPVKARFPEASPAP